MKQLTRITIDPEVMGGKPCIRGLRVTVGTLVGLIHLQNTVGSLSTGLELVIPVQQIGNYQPFN